MMGTAITLQVRRMGGPAGRVGDRMVHIAGPCRLAATRRTSSNMHWAMPPGYDIDDGRALTRRS